MLRLRVKKKREWINSNYYSFKIFPRSWLAKSTRIIHHNQLLMTKFERILGLMNRWRQKCNSKGDICYLENICVAEHSYPRILSLESVDYFGTSEHFSGRKKKHTEKSYIAKLRCWGQLVFHYMQMCLVMRFISGDDWNDAPCSSRIFVSLYTHIACNRRHISGRR